MIIANLYKLCKCFILDYGTVRVNRYKNGEFLKSLKLLLCSKSEKVFIGTAIQFFVSQGWYINSTLTYTKLCPNKMYCIFIG